MNVASGSAVGIIGAPPTKGVGSVEAAPMGRILFAITTYDKVELREAIQELPILKWELKKNLGKFLN